MAPVTTGYASLGNNHHISIYQLSNGKAEFEIVSLYEASKRLARKEPLVRRHGPNGSIFIMSISLGDVIKVPDGEKAGLWVANILSANGQIFFKRINDASPKGETKWGPNPNSLLEKKAYKVSIDPIGRIRRAND